MRNLLIVLCGLLWFATPLRSEVTLSVDILDDGDGESPPAGIIVLDILADLSPDDSWTAAGFHLAAHNGAQIVYSNDPNTGDAILMSPGLTNRFVTCFSRPRPRLGSARFDNAAAAVAGDYCPTGPAPATATPTELNIAYFAVPPQSASSPSVNGAIARIALQANFCGSAPCCSVGVFPIGQIPSGYTTYLECACANTSAGMVASTFDHPQTVGWSWALAVRATTSCIYDMDGDNAHDVNVDDIQAFLPAFASCTGDPAFLAAADLSLDGCIDLSDLATLLAHFGETCCEN